MIDITEFGAKGDGSALCTEAFRQAVAAAGEAGEPVRVPAGTYVTGTIDLQGVSLHLDAGAVVRGSSDPADYPEMPFHHNELGTLRALVVCLGGQDVVIDGEGTIDLNGSSFYDFSSPIVPESRVPFTQAQKAECTVKHSWRPSQSVFFYQVKNLTVKGITVLDAPCWTFSFNECQNVKVLGLTIDTNLNVPNDDGIHVCGCDGGDHLRLPHLHRGRLHRHLRYYGLGQAMREHCDHQLRAAVLLKSHCHRLYLQPHPQRAHRQRDHPGEQPGPVLYVQRPGRPGGERAGRQHGDRYPGAGRELVGQRGAHLLYGVKHDYHIPADQNPHRETPVNYRNIVIRDVICAGGERHWRRGHRKQLRERDAAGHHHGAQALCQFSPEGEHLRPGSRPDGGGGAGGLLCVPEGCRRRDGAGYDADSLQRAGAAGGGGAVRPAPPGRKEERAQATACALSLF